MSAIRFKVAIRFGSFAFSGLQMYPPPSPAKLIDCVPTADADPSLQRELILVEGDSASLSVARVRDERCQAVLPMQGKPMNAIKASARGVRQNVWFSALIDALGVGWHPKSTRHLRYDRVAFLFDPDADGIHCGALMLMFFDRYLRILLDQRRVTLIKPPQFEVRASGFQDRLHAMSEEHLRQVRAALAERGIAASYTRYRGLASLDDATLKTACVDPATRTAYLLEHRDAETAIAYFGGLTAAPQVGRCD